MLSRSTHNHIAFQLSPWRERRLVCFANDDDNDSNNLERLSNQPEQLDESSVDGISPVSEQVNSRINNRILATEKLEAVLSQPAGIIALIEHGHPDLRDMVERQMRADEPEYYSSAASREHLPVHEIVWYLRDHESTAAQLRSRGIERLQDPMVLQSFTAGLQLQLQKLRDIQNSVAPVEAGLRLKGLDAARLYETETWLQQQCDEHGLQIPQANLKDWMEGSYDAFKPGTKEVRRVLHYITGQADALPESLSIATEDEQLKARLEERIRQRVGEDDDKSAIITATGKATRSFLVRSFSHAAQALRKRKLWHLFLNQKPTDTDENTFAGLSLDEQIATLQEQIITARSLLLEELKRRAEVLHGTLKRRITTEFREANADNSVSKFGMSQTLLANALSATLQPLETIIWSPVPVTDDRFDRFAEDASQTIDQLAASPDMLKNDLDTARLDHEDTIAWCTHLADSNRLQIAERTLADSPPPAVVGDMPAEQRRQLRDLLLRLQRVAEGSASGSDFDAVEQEVGTLASRQRLTLLITTLSSPRLAEQAKAAGDALEQSNLQNTTTERERLQSEYEELKESMATLPAMNHTVCKALHLDDGLGEHFTKIRLNLAAAREHETDAVGQQYIRSAADTAERIRTARTLLGKLETTVIREENAKRFAEQHGAGTEEAAAFYNADTGNIILNMEVIRARGLNEDLLIQHEKGHAILDIFTRRTELFAGLLIRTGEYLNQRVPQGQLPGQNLSFRELLEKQAPKWKVDRKRPLLLERARKQGLTDRAAQTQAQEQYQDLLMDELLNKYGSWVDKGRPVDNTDPEQIILFRHIETELQPEDAQLDQSLIDNGRLADEGENLGEALGLYEDGDTDPTTQQNSGDNAAAEETAALNDVNGQLTELRRGVDSIKIFYDSYPEYKGQLKSTYVEFDKAHVLIQNTFHGGQCSAEQAISAIKLANERLGPILEDIKKIKSEKSDVANAGTTGRKSWRALFDGIQFVSIMDIWKTVQQAGEDLKRIWDRRAAQKQASLGLGLTDWIPDNIPYAGRMSNEFQRRDKEAEQKEVNEWKEKLDEFDSYDLIEMIRSVRNPDQVKAIFMLLTERGRMDWNDTGIWKTLNAMSHYSMPIEACKFDDVLRDKWLQKLINDIYNDKDLYTQWRHANDGAISSKKKDFNSVVDQLSNVDGGLGDELRYQLRLYKAWENGEGASPELNPHLYEEILDYSMRNGKMSMEAKLFYLVQGVASGILSIDRLRTLAGEVGGVLNQYPWLDYFYQKNNSLPEVKALADRLRETDNPDEPGPKTTLWLHLENMRLESARQRISKAISGTRAENLDHEDVPTLVAQADWVNIDRMTGMISGTREKLSPEAIRNAYTGFGTKFKILGYLAQLEKEGVAQFTDKDVDEAAKSIVAYIHMDNIFTRNASKADRPQLTWNVIDTQQGPSTSGLVVGEYRSPQNAFVSELIGDIDIPGINWNDLPINKDNVIRKESSDRKMADSDRNEYDGKQQEERYEALTKKVFGKLQDALRNNPELMKQLLIKYADEFKEENYAGKNWINKDTMKSYFHDRFKMAGSYAQGA